MKSTEINLLDKQVDKSEETKILPENLGPLKSLRPQKSMVRVKSLRPKRLSISRKVSIHTINKK